MNNQMNPQMMPPSAPQMNSPYIAAAPSAPKKKLSGIAVFAMLFAIIFAIAASCMSFLPLLDITMVERGNESNKVHTTAGMLEYTSFGDFGRLDDQQYFNTTLAPKMSTDQDFATKLVFGAAANFSVNFYNTQVTGDQSKYLDKGKMFTVLTTVLFFTMFGVALFVLIGKLMSKSAFGRGLAFFFSLIGLLCAGGYFTWLMIVIADAIKSPLYASAVVTIAPGIGIILMTAFSLLTFIFCCMGLTKKSALKDAAPQTSPAPFYPGAPADNNMQNVVNPVANPYMPAPAAQPMQTPATNYAPQQPVPQQNFAPSVAPVPVSATEDTMSFEVPQEMQQPAAPQPVTEPQPAAAPAMGQIEGIGGDYNGVVIDLVPGDKITVGSDPSLSNIILSSPAGDVSGAHCTISYEQDIDNYKVTDTSATGTFFDGRKLPSNRGIYLPRGTVLSFGTCTTTFKLK